MVQDACDARSLDKPAMMLLMTRPASPDSTRRSPASWASVKMLPSFGGLSKLRLILLLNEGAAGGQQGIGKQGSAQVQREWSDTVAARWAEVPHLIRLDPASIWKMLSAERRRAASDDARRLPTARALSSIRIGPRQSHARTSGRCDWGGPPH